MLDQVLGLSLVFQVPQSSTHKKDSDSGVPFLQHGEGGKMKFPKFPVV